MRKPTGHSEQQGAGNLITSKGGKRGKISLAIQKSGHSGRLSSNGEASKVRVFMKLVEKLVVKVAKISFNKGETYTENPC